MYKNYASTYFTKLFIFTSCMLILNACTASNVLNTLPSTLLSVSPSPSPTSTAVPTGARAIKILFQLGAGGSFDNPTGGTSGGTAATPGSGLQAARVFNPDGSQLNTGAPGTSGWPGWLSSFEVGISGASNASAPYSYCANFANFDVAAPAENTLSNCFIGPAGSVTASQCGAPSGMFRVSEVDCSLGPSATAAGSGGPNDGVYFRAVFNRNSNYIASTENILVVMEYFASTLNPAPANPTQCFTSGKFTPEACSDFVWKAYIKHSVSEFVQPYLVLVPPTFSSILTPGTTGPQNSGTGIATKQFFIPLAGDQNLTVLQVSRTQSNFSGSPATSGTAAYNLLHYCTAAAAVPGKSPLCSGMIFYSITFFRM